jgi:hypothetical protein
MMEGPASPLDVYVAALYFFSALTAAPLHFLLRVEVELGLHILRVRLPRIGGFFFLREWHGGVRRWLGRQKSTDARPGRERWEDDKVASIGLARPFYAIGHRFGFFCLLVPY